MEIKIAGKMYRVPPPKARLWRVLHQIEERQGELGEVRDFGTFIEFISTALVDKYPELTPAYLEANLELDEVVPTALEISRAIGELVRKKVGQLKN